MYRYIGHELGRDVLDHELGIDDLNIDHELLCKGSSISLTPTPATGELLAEWFGPKYLP